MEKAIWYFAYGSNMDEEQMRARVEGWSERVAARLAGWKLAFNKVAVSTPGAGYANIEPCGEAVVEGVLYALTERELRLLDRCEGVPNHYERRPVQVERRDTGEVVDAVTYVAKSDKVQAGLKPSADYLAHLLAGADCLSPGYLQRLQSTETLDREETK